MHTLQTAQLHAGMYVGTASKNGLSTYMHSARPIGETPCLDGFGQVMHAQAKVYM